MRLQKYLAHCGIASRRKSEELIKKGLVKVNGKIVTEMGYKVDISIDEVMYEGEVVTPEVEHVYIMLNKPEGVITSSKDQFDRETVLDFVKTDYRIYPVGRLDYDTSGMILLTNDGEFANQMMHPNYKVPKTYHALVEGSPKRSEIVQFESGLLIDGQYTYPASLEVLTNECNSLLKIIISEGRNRQVRKMCEAIGHPVIKLKRVAIGNVMLGSLDKGQWRYLTDEEIIDLKKV